MRRNNKGTLMDYFLNSDERLNSFSSRIGICNLKLKLALKGFPSLNDEEIYKLIFIFNPIEDDIRNFLKLKRIGSLNEK